MRETIPIRWNQLMFDYSFPWGIHIIFPKGRQKSKLGLKQKGIFNLLFSPKYIISHFSPLKLRTELINFIKNSLILEPKIKI